MSYEEKRDRNKHVEEIIDYLVDNNIKCPNFYKISDEEFWKLKEESDKYFVRKVVEKNNVLNNTKRL